MVLLSLALFALSLTVLMKSATYCTRFSTRLARQLHLSEFTVSFFIVAVICVLPEASVSIIAATRGIPEFGLGTLLGSNITDLTLVFGIVALFSMSGIHVKSKILKKDFFYLALLFVPFLLGIDGSYSRVDGILLILCGLSFFLTLSIEGGMFKKPFESFARRSVIRDVTLLIMSLCVLALAAYYTVKSAIDFAQAVNIPAIFMSLTIVAIGTCLPELTFSIRAIMTHHDELALGDVLGTVITDATIVLGLVVLIQPFTFAPSLIYLTGLTMFFAATLTVLFIRSGKLLSKYEALCLIFFYIIYLIMLFIAHEGGKLLV